MINKYPVLANIPNKVFVHDAASNIKSAVRDNLKEDSLLCGDHLINTSLAHASKDVSDIKEMLKVASDLASRVHRSTLSNEVLRSECEKLNIPHIKIITPVSTRWNSNCMMLESILKMKDALVAVREGGNASLQDVIPSDKDFSLMEVLVPVLKSMRTLSESFSKDSEPVLHSVLVGLYRTEIYLSKYPTKPTPCAAVIRDFCSHLSTNLNTEARFDSKGLHNKHYCLAHLLHPHYRGHLLKKFDKFEAFVQDLIDNHPSTQEFLNREAEKARDLSSSPDSPRDEDDFELFDIDDEISTEKKQANTSQGKN